MPLCGSSTCGCALASVPAASGEINGALPTIDVAGNGTPASPWNLTLNSEWAAEVAARRVIGYAITTSSQGSITTTPVDITGLTATWTADSARLYRTTVFVQVQSNVDVTDWALGRITDGSDVQKQSLALDRLSNIYGKPMTMSLIESGLSGSITRKARMVRLTGSGTLTVQADPTYPGYLVVEDIGPA